ncbi:hypothetical protein HYU13_06045 [Candidatus Woesearchaeota archaeon]|nr:hypothetical protein [Candidatus Woesearchaeota archaeon]
MKHAIPFLVLIAFCILASAQAAFGEVITEFDFIIGKDRSVQLLQSRTFEGSGILPGPAASSFELSFFDQQGNIITAEKLPIAFFRLHNHGQRGEDVDAVPVTVRTPFQQQWETGKLLENGRSIFTFKPMAMLCNRNRLCDGYENFLSCPFDCSSASQDGWCNRAKDRGCDPDCIMGDEDCSVLATPERVSSPPFDYLLFFLSVTLIVGLSAVAMEIRKRR